MLINLFSILSLMGTVWAQELFSNIETIISQDTEVKQSFTNDDSCKIIRTYQNISEKYDRLKNINWQWKHNHSIAECSGITSKTFQTFGIGHEPHLNSILFKDSNISLLSVGALHSYPDLTELYINNSNVENIHPGVFTSLSNLNELHLEYNFIRTISKGIFNSLPKLSKLYISHNNITLIEEQAFIGLFKLRILDISFNMLKYVSSSIFEDLHNLKEIDVSHNDFVEFVIENAPNILVLDVSCNELGTFNFSMFKSSLANINLANNKIDYISSLDNVAIYSLDLSHNNLTHIDYVEPHLTYLNFSTNQFESLTDNFLFNSSIVLQTLDFSNNVISVISADVFSELRSLRNLLLQNNLIDDIPVGCFRNMKYLTALNLSSNLLTDLSPGIFTGLSVLIYLDVSNNKLTVLDDGSLHPLKNLRVLHISQNKLQYSDSQKLLDISKKMRYVSFHSNIWTCKVLSQTINNLEIRGVIVEEGLDKKNSNIHGITCQSSSEYETNTITDNNSKTSTGVFETLKSLRNYFDKDFLKSAFYKYFESLKSFNFASNITKNYIDGIKLIDEIFENSKLYKFFNSDLPKANALKQLATDLTNIVQIVNNSKVYYTNVTLQNSLHKDLLDTSASFERNLNKALDKVDLYMDRIFNNSRFADILNNLNNDNKVEKQEREVDNVEKLLAHFSPYTSERKSNDAVSQAEMLSYFNKYEKRMEQSFPKNENSNSTIILSVIIVILAGILVFIAFNRFVKTGRGFFRKASRVSPNESRINLSNSRIEMI